ncbi:MAG: aminotransferase class I/II-fold pyridoxal phosphate-dependent enzyme [Bacteroidetes bacterium]|nr:aminotransferase class I/II-fold pyridoxal phosphate-dependent enzyme [Bacteroidota bacterium]
MALNRREWLRQTSLTGGLALVSGLGFVQTLSAAEKKKFRPRPFENPIRLSSNENPYGPSEKVRQTIVDHFDIACRYPYQYGDELVSLLAQKEGVTPNHIVLTGGSTEALRITGLTFAANGGEIIAGQPTFLAMMDFAEKWGASINWVPVNEKLEYDLQEIEKRVSDKTKLVFLCNPNNPTGTIVPKNDLVDFCRSVSSKTIVFSDEAYYDFIDDPGYPSMISLVKADKNVIVSRTFSKVYGLAGLRIGYLVAKPEIAMKIKANIVAFTNVAAIVAARTAMEDTEFYNFSLQQIKGGKQIIYKHLDELNLPYIPSQTNFVFFKSGKDINWLNQQFKAQGILVGRPFPPFTDWCRISIGTPEEVRLFNQKLSQILKA